MKKKRIHLFTGATLVMLFGLALAHAEDAQKLYGAKCASCHGKDGKGNPAMAKVFKVEPAALALVPTSEAKDKDFVKITTEGKGKMPAFKGKLTGKEIEDLAAYVTKLETTPAPKAK